MYVCTPARILKPHPSLMTPFTYPSPQKLAVNHPHPPSHIKSLKPLLRNLRLGLGDGGRSVGVEKVAAVLAVLELGGLGRADADAARVGAAPGPAVGVVDAPARDELRPVARADVLSARVVGGDLRRGGEGD